MDLTATLQQLGVSLTEYAGPDLAVRSPIDGVQLTSLRGATRRLRWRPALPRLPRHSWSGATSQPHNAAGAML
jgi:hypothetical protein